MTLPPPSRLSGHLRTTLLSLSLALALVPIGTATAQEAAPAPDEQGSGPPLAISAEMQAAIDAVIAVVPEVRDLPDASDVAYRIIDPTTFRVELEELFREEYSEEHLAAEEAAFKRLGLLEPDADLARLILSLYDSQVLAFYDPRTTTFTLIGPIDGIGPLEEIVVAHEYAHALQDATWGLEGQRIRDLSRSDALLAQQALVEGDATAAMFDWAEDELGPLELVQVAGEAMLQQDAGLLAQMPPILRRQLEFPYLEGWFFVNAIRADGGWDAVDAAWDAQPVSTEQILHPELYPAELPVEIELPDVAASLGEGWVGAYQQTLGEMQMGVWLDGADQAAAGWGGDRLVSLDGPDGAWAVIWQTDWDSAPDRDEFRSAAQAAMEDLPGAHLAVDADIVGGLSSPVLVVVADRAETLSTIRAELSLGS
jgi:hypothetical protein